MKSDIGFLQELQMNGQVANSFMRKLETMFFCILVVYMAGSSLLYQNHFNQFVTLLKAGCITEQSFNMLISNLKMYDWDTLLILIVATVAPKVVQKFAEAKTGIKIETESNSQLPKTGV
jgi:hypothetical protein